MSENVEVLKYLLDISDVETKTRKMTELHSQIVDAEKSGRDSGGLRSQLAAEAEALSHVSRKADETGLSVEKLTKNKRALNEVAHLLGAEFGGLIPELGGLVHIMESLGAAAFPIVGIFAAVGAAGAIFERISESARKAKEEVAKLHEASEKLIGSQKTAGEQMDESLRKTGQLNPETSKRARDLRLDAEALGTPVKDATELAGIAAVSKSLTGQDIQLLAAAGFKPEDAQQAEQMIALLRSSPDLLANTQAAARGIGASSLGVAAKADAAAAKASSMFIPRYEEQVAGETQDAALLELAKRFGISGVSTIGDIDRLRKRAEELHKKDLEHKALAQNLLYAPGGLSEVERAEMRKLDLLGQTAFELHNTGVPDAAGKIREVTVPTAQPFRPGLSDADRQQVTIINQNFNHSTGTHYDFGGGNPNNPFGGPYSPGSEAGGGQMEPSY